MKTPIASALSRLLRRMHYIRVKHLSYAGDGMIVSGRNTEFLSEPRFVRSYARGMHSGHLIGGRRNVDLHIEWRVHVACWAAAHGATIPGHFVECGVNTGVLSLAVCEYTDFNSLDKDFYLFDTFAGIPESQMTSKEKPGRLVSNQKYEDCYETALNNFRPFPRAQLIQGTIPSTLDRCPIEQVAYLSIDMNITYPERQAIAHFWPRLTPSACVLLDDYGFCTYEEQKRSMDDFAASKGVEILSLPTGQGLLIKPAERSTSGR